MQQRVVNEERTGAWRRTYYFTPRSQVVWKGPIFEPYQKSIEIRFELQKLWQGEGGGGRGWWFHAEA